MALLGGGGATAAETTTVYEPNHESLTRYGVPEWFDNAKLGLYLHFGLNSVPAMSGQYASQMYWTAKEQDSEAVRAKNGAIRKHHEETHGSLGEFGYKDFIPMLGLEEFDADYYADLAVRCGARYFLELGVHHGGFAMFDSTHFPFNVAQMGPKRDVVGEMFAACRERGLKVGISTHIGRHWRYYTFRPEYDTWDPQYEGLYGRRRADNEPPVQADWEKWEATHREIISKYQPDYIFTDGGINDANRYTDGFIKALYTITAQFYSESQSWGDDGVVLTQKRHAMKHDEAVTDSESLAHINAEHEGILPFKWQLHTPLTGWHYVKKDESRTVNVGDYLRLLAEVISRNGNLLIGITCRPTGILPENQIGALDEIEAWMKVNSEAVHDTAVWQVHGGGVFCRRWLPRGTKEDIDAVRFTTKGDAIYAFIGAETAGSELIIDELTGERLGEKTIAAVELLGASEPLGWKHGANGLSVTVPAILPSRHVAALKIITK
jgi:alpha-L-fucosidase